MRVWMFVTTASNYTKVGETVWTDQTTVTTWDGQRLIRIYSLKNGSVDWVDSKYLQIHCRTVRLLCG